jgi:hypothetical protein
MYFVSAGIKFQFLKHPNYQNSVSVIGIAPKTKIGRKYGLTSSALFVILKKRKYGLR